MIDAGHWCQRRRRSDPSTRLPIRLVNSRQVGPPASLAVCCPDHLAQHRHRGLQHRVWLATSRRPHPHLLESGLAPVRLALPIIPCVNARAVSLRWIRD